jgi:hypothetical protein
LEHIVKIQTDLRRLKTNSEKPKEWSNSVFFRVASIAIPQITLSSFPSKLIFITHNPLLPKSKTSLGKLTFVVSICSYLVYHHWFRNNLE